MASAKSSDQGRPSLSGLLLAGATRALLGLRYRIEFEGLDQVAERGRRGILFLANHPALIDPVILSAVLYRRFRPRPLGDRGETARPGVRWVARHLRAIEVPDPVLDGAAAAPGIAAALDACVAALAAGDNLLLYPSGHLATSSREDLRGNSATHAIVERVPGARVVLLRLDGLWGSRFSRAVDGFRPDLGSALRSSARDLLLSGLLFMPRRRLRLEALELDDVPRGVPREELNRFLEARFNRDPSPSTHVPATPWERGGVRVLEDPGVAVAGGDGVALPDATRRLVLDRLREVSGVDEIREGDHLARDLGLDSLLRAELVAWLGEELGFHTSDVDSVLTVRDVLLAAGGHGWSSRQAPLRPVPVRWFSSPARGADPALPAATTVTGALLERALAEPDTLIVSDQVRGARTYRDLLTACLLLRGPFARLPGDRVGVMLPASVGADVVLFAALFAGKVPVMVNWTAGPRQVASGLETAGVRVVLTARALVDRLSGQGFEPEAVGASLVYLEELATSLGLGAKLRALAHARLEPRRLLRADVPDTAVVLFTSGSEALPKAVPLSHANLLANLRDIGRQVAFERGDSLLSVLPPFHSFGLTAGVLMPLLFGIPTVHHPDPREGAMMARLVAAHRLTLAGGTPTFLAAMARAAASPLESLRLLVLGGEACPDAVWELLARACPRALILEGYGVSECSPIVAINSPAAARRGTVGRVMPSLEHAVVDPESHRRLGVGERGELLVRGPSVFAGYLGEAAASPFVDLDDRRFYRTGDLVTEDDDGFITLHGRRRRFVKVGGEMVSLPAVEAALAERFGEGEEGPTLAVAAREGEGRPELTLVTTLAVDRQLVNRAMRDAGLSALHNVQRVVRVETIPVLGTGKTDHRAVAELVARLDA